MVPPGRRSAIARRCRPFPPGLDHSRRRAVTLRQAELARQCRVDRAPHGPPVETEALFVQATAVAPVPLAHLVGGAVGLVVALTPTVAVMSPARQSLRASTMP
jgi:hypothetical protein